MPLVRPPKFGYAILHGNGHYLEPLSILQNAYFSHAICSCWHSSLLNVRTLEIPHCTQKLRLKLLYRTASLLNAVWCTHFGISLLHYMHYIPSVHMCAFAHMCIICIKWGVHTCIGHAFAQLYDIHRFFSFSLHVIVCL